MADEQPEPAPSKSVRRPYWVMRLVRRSAVYGGFVTPTLFVPAAVYQQAGATIPGVASKIAAFEAILFTLTHRVVPIEVPNESNAAGLEQTVSALREARAEFSAVQSSLNLTFSFIDDPDVADRPPSGEESDSTLAAAALGNAFSNGCGMFLHGTIERFAGALGLPDPRLTIHQRGYRSVKNVKMAAGIIGVVFGAITVGLVANAVFFIPAIDGAWFRVFLGAILLAAVFANERIRKRITGGI